MNLILNVILISVVAIFAQAKIEDPRDLTDCTVSELTVKTNLACVSCALQRVKRPVDDKYLALMGLLVRENVALFPSKSKITSEQPTRSSLVNNTSHIEPGDKNVGDVKFTARGQYQRFTMQMLLASGYCAPGKVKSTASGYENVMSRIRSDEYVVGWSTDKFLEKKEKAKVKEREAAAKELGHSNWTNAKRDFFMDKDGVDFFELDFEQQKEFYRGRRLSALTRHGDSQIPKTDIGECLNDIDSNYSKPYSSAEESYVACRAIYDACGINTDPLTGDTRRKNAAGQEVLVGGDPCKKFYKKPVSVGDKRGGAVEKIPGPRPGQLQGPPIELGTSYLHLDGVVTNSQGDQMDTTKTLPVPGGAIFHAPPEGGTFIPNSAFKQGDAWIRNPAPTPAPSIQAPATATPSAGSNK